MNQHKIYQLNRPIIFAHRGASAYAPENTLAAFELAMKQNAPAIELDVTLTQDHQVVVFHDSHTERVTGVKGKVNEMTLDAIKKLDAGSYFDPSFEGERIPTLEEVFELVGKKILINIELKNYLTPFDPLPQAVANLVQKWKLENNVLISSFNPIALIRTKSLLPDVPIAMLALSGKSGWLARSRIAELIHYQAIHPHYSDINAKFLASHHAKGHLVNAYTVDDAAVMRSLIDLGIDGIITDDPLLAHKQLNTLEHRIEAQP